MVGQRHHVTPARAAARTSPWNTDGGCCVRVQVAAGSKHGDVCMYDISSGRLEAVQRIHLDEGPVTALACRLMPQHRHDTATAIAPRGRDGGSLVEGPMGLPWRLPPHSGQPSRPEHERPGMFLSSARFPARQAPLAPSWQP